MAEATGSGNGRREMVRAVVRRSMEDDSFRRALVADPRAAIEQAFGTELPEGGEIRVVEETADVVYLVLPPRSAVGPSGELSDSDLEAVAGGDGGSWPPKFTAATCWPECISV